MNRVATLRHAHLGLVVKGSAWNSLWFPRTANDARF
jgi:hypothetical protein